ncbi:hypothetical protein [Haladaptatus sp. CMSO5]|uniref:hypothetical protein n=1 Tax=Haladaptatus sp. CMSO5 TaxID=3120514 RepID=UPI002FCE687D
MNRLLATVGGTLLSIGGGAWFLLTGLLDPSFLAHPSLYYPAVSLFSKYIGPKLLPGVPWDGIFLMAAVVMFGSMLVGLDKKRKKRNNS